MLISQPTTRERIRRLLSDGVPRTASMVAAELSILPNTAYKVLQRMERAGQVERDSHGYVRLPRGGTASKSESGARNDPPDPLTARFLLQASGAGQPLASFAVRSSAGSERQQPVPSRMPVPQVRLSEARKAGLAAADAEDPAPARAGIRQAEFPAYFGHSGVVEPEYDLLEPYTLLDTEVYFRQAIQRRLSLMFRNGVRIMADSPALESYLKRRISQMELVMQQGFEGLLKDILFNLLVSSNCILVKIRNESGQVAGYRIIPPYHILPVLDGRGRIARWRHFTGYSRVLQDYDASEVVHFYWDRKPGHIFGTPRTIAVRDDIVALRRIEEHMELLLNRMLFPLFHFRVGTEKAPCQITADGVSEIDVVRRIIESMPRDGMLITDERVEGRVLESGLRGIDITPVLDHYKRRVVTGLGVSSLDLGEPDTSNRATADNVSQNLKDAVASDCAWFAGQVKQLMFRDWIAESPEGWNVQRALSRISLEFPEIDVDSMIKLETHAINAFNNNAITLAELRARMKLPPLSASGRRDTHFLLHTVPLALLRGSAGRNPAENQVRTAVQPENQHGRNLGPTKARSSSGFRGPEQILAEIRDVADMLESSDLAMAAEVWAVSSGWSLEQASRLSQAARRGEAALSDELAGMLASMEGSPESDR